jgi:hypothetical protein
MSSDAALFICIDFFIRMDKTQLADFLERALQEAIKDGAFAKLFEQYYGAAVKTCASRDSDGTRIEQSAA